MGEATDRELLEAAALAAGVDLDLSMRPDGLPLFCSDRGLAINTVPGWWGPLTDDGDALRLAIDLNICVEFGYCRDDAPIVSCGQLHERESWPQVGNYPDPYAATRRAIVRAAASIGRNGGDGEVGK